VLGPLVAEDEHGPINLKGSRHRAVLARLLVARGRVVPVTWLIDDLWASPPEGALGAVQTFVGTLRKALEPDRPPRTPSRLLVTAPPGYALRASLEAVDAWRFEAAVAAAAQLPPAEARVVLDDVLGLWRGPAYAEFADQDWARGEAARLDELRLLAVERRAEAASASGRAAEAVADLEAHVAGHPLRENGWGLLALALYRTGRQGDALATLRRAREVLRTELGVDPGQDLRQLESDVLAQAPHLAHAPPTPVTSSKPVEHPFVGRTAELASLSEAAAGAAAAGGPRLALLSGAAGAGKTALARTLTERLAATGWTTAWGSSPELPGAPAAWPWTQMRESLAAAGAADPPGDLPCAPAASPGPRDVSGGDPVTVRYGMPSAGAEPPGASGAGPWTQTGEGLGPDGPVSGGDPVAARFRRHRAIGSFLAAVSARSPVLLVFDDLHWADEETLALLTALVTDPDVGPVLVLGTYRSTEISAGLAEALGRAARTEPSRIYLGGLTEPQVRELVQAITYRDMPPGDARVIHARSGGNPFFVRELIRLWEAEGEAALHTVPIGVRDVIRHRLATLPETARTHLRQAAVIGQEVDLDVLTRLAGHEDAVLDSVESALLAGFLVEQDADRLRFAHALVRETLYADITRARRARWHAALADIVEETRPEDVEAIAHHLLRAEGQVASARTAHYARLAAERAERRFAPHEAARLWRETVAAESDDRAHLEAVMGMVRALAVTGDLPQARRHRAEAVTAAEALGDPVLTAGVIGSFDVPAIWTTNDDEALSARLAEAAERTLAALSAGHSNERARLLITIAMERRADAGGRGSQAALEAETIARGLDDPTLLAFALNGRFLQTFSQAGLAPRRARIGEELLDLSRRHGLVTFEVLAHLILVQARAALADLVAADRHAAAADLLASRYDLPLVGVFTDWYAALRLAVTGRADEARTAYRAAASRLSGTGMSGVEEGILPLALLSLGATDLHDWGPYENWARPLVLLAQGNREQALARSVPDSPRDLLFEARTCLHAMIAIEAGDRLTMERLYAELLPAALELAGAGSGLVTFGPTALHLGHLCVALGRCDEAAGHYRQALVVADEAHAPQWTAAALDALQRLD
jgi:DNA-binding SARP family transcriptional activator